MQKVLLISPPFERFMGLSRFYYHIGLASLAAVLKKEGFDVLVYDADYDINGHMLTADELMERHHCYKDALEGYEHPVWKEVQSVVNEFEPDVIGISVLSITLPSVYHMIPLLKRLRPDAMIFTGGVHATLCPEDLLDVSDYVITNEGEYVIADVVRQKLSKGIVKGIRVENLDMLPYPAIDRLYQVEKYNKRDLSIAMSTRGCPNACKFCSSFDLWRCKTTRKSVDYFIKEIEHLIQDYGIRDLFITDDTFTCDYNWLFDFLEKIKKLNITWRCFSRVEAVTEEIIDKLIEAGCRNIKLGIESGSQRILDMVNKGITIEQILEADRILREKNIKWSAYFIIGFPNETEQDIRETQNIIRRISADSITVNAYTPLPKNRLDNNKADYKIHSFHSPNNNFTGCIDNVTFKKLLDETIALANRKYNEHVV